MNVLCSLINQNMKNFTTKWKHKLDELDMQDTAGEAGTNS